MGIFNFGKKNAQPVQSAATGAAVPDAQPVDMGKLAELALRTIQDGILIVNKDVHTSDSLRGCSIYRRFQMIQEI